MLPGQNLKCQTPADVYLLLKSSDFISHDLDHAFEDCVDFPTPSPSAAAPRDSNAGVERVGEGLAAVDLDTTRTAAVSDDDEEASEARPRGSSTTGTTSTRPFEFELVLKKWFDMPKSQEWRCFVRQDRLLGEWRVLKRVASCIRHGLSACLAAPKQVAHPPLPLVPFFCSSPYHLRTGKCRHLATRHDSVRLFATRTSSNRDPRPDPTLLGGIDPRPCALVQLYVPHPPLLLRLLHNQN